MRVVNIETDQAYHSNDKDEPFAAVLYILLEPSHLAKKIINALKETNKNIYLVS